MNIEKYLDKPKEQMRNKKTKEFVTDEIKNNIENRDYAYIDSSISRDEVYIKPMNNMVESMNLGVDTNKIHSPQLEWKLLIYIMLMSILSIGAHYIINHNLNLHITGADDYVRERFAQHTLNITIGIIVMILIYQVDYTVLLKSSRIIGSIFLVVITFACGMYSYDIGGRSNWIIIGSVSIYVNALFLLYLPIFSGILCECQGKGKGAVIQIIFWMLAPLVSRYLNDALTLPFSMFIIVSEAAIIYFAVIKKWYPVRKKVLIAGFVIGLVLFCTAFILFISFNLSEYQKLRIENWLANFNIGGYVSDDYGVNYVNSRLVKIFSESYFLGKSDTAVNIAKRIPGFRTDLIIGSISAYLGKLAVAVLIIFICILIVYIFQIALGQKNNLGYIVGCACSITIALQCISNILIVFGILPFTGSVQPIISYSQTHNIVNYVLFGLILSTYRYKDIRYA